MTVNYTRPSSYLILPTKFSLEGVQTVVIAHIIPKVIELLPDSPDVPRGQPVQAVQTATYSP